MFQISLPVNELRAYVLHQLNNFFPDNKIPRNEELLFRAFDQALERTEFCFKHVALKAYNHDSITFFSHLHADQYTVFLWFLSNSVWKEFEDEALASKMFYLNKLLNGVMCMYDAQMPDIFLILHGSGTVLGKANYSDFFVCYHGCTVGAIHGVYPVLKKGVAMAPQSAVIGNCIVGPCSTIGNHALLRNQNLDKDHLYYCDASTGQAMTRPVENCWAQSFFNVPIF